MPGDPGRRVFPAHKKPTPPVVITLGRCMISHYVPKPDGDIVCRFLAASNGIAHNFNIFVDSLDAEKMTLKATVFSGATEAAVYFDIKQGSNQPNIDVPIEVGAGDRLILKVEGFSKKKAEQTGEISGIWLSFVFKM